MIAPDHHSSSILENVLEHRFIGEVTTDLWRRGFRQIEVLRSEVDCGGYDIVLEANGIVRHIQLKAMIQAGKRRDVGVNLLLASKPSGCVVWMAYNPSTLELGPFLWLGGRPGEPLPPLDARVVKHSKGNGTGYKAQRRGHRLVRKSAFERVASVEELVTRLFGTGSNHELTMVREHIAARASATTSQELAEEVGGLKNWDASAELAHRIDGYELAANLGIDDLATAADRWLAAAEAGRWPTGAATLWTWLFIEHRRWRMAGHEPGADRIRILDELCIRLASEAAAIAGAAAAPDQQLDRASG